MSGFRVAVRAQLGSLDLDVDLCGNSAPLALLGPNGSGKTTLLRLIMGALTPADGEIEVGGRTLFSSARGIDLASEHRRVGYLPQGYGLFPHLCAVDNVAFGLSTGKPRPARAARRDAARGMLAALECVELSERFPHELSGGEQQRVALARALVVEPTILLLDEPLAALDAGKRRRVRAFLAQRLLSLGLPCIVITHDVRDVAALGARVCVMDAGRIVQSGSLEALRAEPASELVAELVD